MAINASSAQLITKRARHRVAARQIAMPIHRSTGVRRLASVQEPFLRLHFFSLHIILQLLLMNDRMIRRPGKGESNTVNRHFPLLAD
jgi:hypothetical protein